MNKAIKIILEPFGFTLYYIEGEGEEAIAQLPKRYQEDVELLGGRLHVAALGVIREA